MRQINKRRLRDGLIISIAAIVVCITIILYSIFMSDQIFKESAEHLEEFYGQVTTSLKSMATSNRTLLRSWENYITNVTNDPERNQTDELQNFIDEQKSACGFTDFYFINLTNNSENEVMGKRINGLEEKLTFRRTLAEIFGNDTDAGAVMWHEDGSRHIIFAVSLLNDERDYYYDVGDGNPFQYNAFAVLFNESDMRDVLDVIAFNNSGTYAVVLPDGNAVLQSDSEKVAAEDYWDFLKNECTVSGISADSLINQWAEQKTGTVLFNTHQGNVEYYLTYMPVGFADWVLLGIVPSQAVNSNMSVFRTVTIVVMVVIFACIIAAVVWILIASSRHRIREKERMLESREQMLEMLTRKSNDIFVTFSTENFEANYVSANVEKVLGVKAEAVKKNIRSIFDAAAGTANPTVFDDLEKRESMFWEEDVPMVNLESGEEYWYHVVMSCAPKGGNGSSILMMSDRTKERKMSSDLNAALEIAKSANEAKRNFLANMSHDIRTPMNAIIGFATLLAKDAENPDKVREYIRKIMFSGQHLLSLINDVLDMSKIESGKTSLHMEEFNFIEFIDELGAIITPQARAKKQIFEVRTKGAMPERVFGDKLRINQILLNLLSNAVKYTPENGRIQLNVEDLDETIHNHVHLKFSVSDNGIGMSEEFVKLIFEPFSRESTAYTQEVQGTGLGMTITKNIVDLMGGTISVESEQGKGSTFIVELKLSVAEHQDHDDETFWLSQNIVKVLVVDDEEEICLEVQSLMKDTGVQVEYALNGLDAVKMVTDAYDGNEEFDVVLLDWKMPGIDGLETAKRIRAKVGAGVPIMVLTSYNFEDIEEEAKSAGIDIFLPKPFFVSNFRNAVTKLKQGAPETKPEAKEEISLKGLKILAAEDNEINAEILAELLEDEGAECEFAHDGKEALDIFAASEPGRYDVIFMDVQMPVMNGYESTRAIRACAHPRAKDIPIIAMTANAFDEDVKAALDSGMNAHLAKPIDMGKLKDIIRKIFGEKK